MKKRYAIYFLVVLLCMILLYLIISFFNASNGVSEVNFLQTSVNFNAEKNETYILNFHYFIDKYKADPIENSTKIQFENSNLIKIQDYKFIEDNITPDYKIKSLELELEFVDVGEEYINSLIFTLKNGEQEIYKMGEFRLNVSDNIVCSSHLQLGDRHPVVTSNLYYTYSLENITDKEIIINNIALNIPGYKFDDIIIIPSNGNKRDTIDADYLKNNDYFQFFIIRPEILYTYENKVYSFYPPATYSNYLNITDEAILEEIKKSSK